MMCVCKRVGKSEHSNYQDGMSDLGIKAMCLSIVKWVDKEIIYFIYKEDILLITTTLVWPLEVSWVIAPSRT